MIPTLEAILRDIIPSSAEYDQVMNYVNQAQREQNKYRQKLIIERALKDASFTETEWNVTQEELYTKAKGRPLPPQPANPNFPF